jgi:hypothetical protein
MNRKTSLALVVLFICILAAAGVIASIKSATQENQNSRGDCEQACTRQYQDCVRPANANRPQCQQTMQSCRNNCKKTAASPSPTAEPTASAEATATVTPTP